jgi:hypothetical protein
MADFGVGETALAAEAIGASEGAAYTGGSLYGGSAFGGESALSSLGAGGSFAPAAGMGADAFTLGNAYTSAGLGTGLGAGADYWSGLAANSSLGSSGLANNIALANAAEDPIAAMNASQGWTGANAANAAASTPDFASQAAKVAATNQAAKNALADPSFMQNPLGWMKANPIKTAAAGAGIYTLANMLKGGALTKPNYLQPYTPPSAQSVGLGRTMASNYAPQRNAIYNRGYAAGGEVGTPAREINTLNIGPGSVATSGVAPSDLTQSSGIQNLLRQYNVTPQQVQQGLNTLGLRRAATGGLMSSPPTPGLMDGGQSGNVDFMGGDMYPMSQQHRSYYATPTQAPTSAQEAMASYEPRTNPLTGEPTAHMAAGGIADLGSYSDGGRMLKGPGDGMSDNIPATIGGKQPARLADGEFVVPADVVSHLGNGSTDAGAKQLYSMMNKVRKARTGTTKQGKEINPKKYLKA